MSAQTIYFKLVEAGMSPEGACAMMGNMWAESGGKSNNVQDGYGYSDEQYTAMVDGGGLDAGYSFIYDSIGYGLCQWTFSTRKKNMLDFHRARNKSIGDEDTQVDFCVQELRSEYPKLWLYLCDCKGVEEATDRICAEYERPAVNNFQPRRDAANGFYMSFGGIEPSQSPSVTAPPEGEPSTAEEVYWPPRTLELGMFGPDVVALQGLLIAHGYPAGISGTFDGATRLMTMAFQAEQGLVGDGIAGPLTWAALTKRG